ncbi:MAG: hypothetical protein ACF8PN_07460 [Phycisphaerales bacterium]
MNRRLHHAVRSFFVASAVGLVAPVTVEAQCETFALSLDDTGVFAPTTVAMDPFDLSADGMTLAIGAAVDRQGSLHSVGSVLVYRRETSGAWTLDEKILNPDPALGDQFGWSVALSGDGRALVVGALTDDIAGQNSGAVYVYGRTDSGWTLFDRLEPSDYSTGDLFGASVGISSDGSTIVAGATNTDTVRVFERAGTRWIEQAAFDASSTQSGDRFGESLDLSADGDTLLVGAPRVRNARGAFEGAAYIFERDGSNWSESAMIRPETSTGVSFGWALALAQDGSAAAIGSPGESPDGLQFGAAYIFERHGDDWREALRVTSDLASIEAPFAIDMSVDGDGDTALFPVPAGRLDTPGEILVYRKSGDDWVAGPTIRSADPDPLRVFAVRAGLEAAGATVAALSSRASFDDITVSFHSLGAGCDLVLSAPAPGLAGQVNSITANWQNVGDRIQFAFSTRTGSVAIPGCPGVTTDLARPTLIGEAIVDSNHEAIVNAFVPPGASGTRVFLQALQSDACAVSNLVEHQFP